MKKYVCALIALALTICLFSAGSQGIAYGGPSISNGQVIGLQPLTAIRIIKEASNGEPGCFVWARTFLDGSKGYLFAKPFQDMWGFVVMSGNQDSWANLFKGGVGGNAANIKTFNDFVRAIETDGWAKLQSSQVPQWIRTFSVFALGASKHMLYVSKIAAETGSAAGGFFFIAAPASVFGAFGDELLPAKIDN